MAVPFVVVLLVVRTQVPHSRCKIYITATCYFMYALTLVLGPLPAPSKINVLWARGTTATCAARDFLCQSGSPQRPFAHAFLVWMYVLLVKYNWSEQRLRTWVGRGAGVAATVAPAMATFPATLGYYNYNSETKCWNAKFPYPCHDYDHQQVDCIRGAHANQMQMLYFLFPHWFLLFANVTALFLIWCAVRQLENRITKYPADIRLPKVVVAVVVNQSAWQTV